MGSVKRTAEEAAKSAKLQAEIAATLTKKEEMKKAIYHSVANRKCVEFVPHEVANVTFRDDHKKQYITNVGSISGCHCEFKIAKDWSVNFFGNCYVPKYGIYWRDTGNDKYFFVSDYRPFQAISTVKDVKIWCCNRRYCRRKNIKERFHQITIKRSGILFHEIQLFIYENNLQDVVPQWSTSLIRRENGGSGYNAEERHIDSIKRSFKKYSTVVRGRGHAQGVGQLKSMESGDPLNIAEAIQCKCDVHAAFARAKRQGEMEYV